MAKELRAGQSDCAAEQKFLSAHILSKREEAAQKASVSVAVHLSKARDNTDTRVAASFCNTARSACEEDTDRSVVKPSLRTSARGEDAITTRSGRVAASKTPACCVRVGIAA